jgi:hypothetical protein
VECVLPTAVVRVGVAAQIGVGAGRDVGEADWLPAWSLGSGGDALPG